ncbi:21749_t:CDS:2 [Racocetra persica]|uniref:21749_t:CDS:1 n=1 Tax=Racocetra persica TaxID=160502 RepID=A0ACA9LAL1_9GLOM|nr:21749_t:CDS:2 [Racocetra persica]
MWKQKKDKKQLEKINLTSEEWLFIEEVIPVLEENFKYHITSLSVRKESELLQKRLKTKLYSESLFGESSFDSCGSGNGDKIDRYLVLQEISKDQNAQTW